MRHVLALVCALLALTSLSAYGQPYFSIRPDSISNGEMQFPYFERLGSSTLAGDSLGAHRINTFLALSEMFTIRGTHRRIFDVITKSDALGGLYGGKVSLQYSIYSNTPRLLSLSFYEMASGATMHYWSTYYLFNPQNGDRIDLHDLFTPAGWKHFVKLSLSKRKAEFKRDLRREHNPLDSEEIESLRERYYEDDFSACYVAGDTIHHNGWDILTPGEYKGGIDFDFETSFVLPEFQSWLNLYGRAVFGLESVSDSTFARDRSHGRPQLLTGTLGKRHIELILGKEQKGFSAEGLDIEGIYAYNRFGIGISLNGNLVGNKLTVKEWECEDCTIHGTVAPSKFSGHWTNAKTGKRLKVVAIQQ